MIKNYFKLAWRSMQRNKGFFAINFLGLFISVSVSLVIAVIIFHETSFDKSADPSISVYRVVRQEKKAGGITSEPVTPYPLATAMRTAMPEEALISQIHNHNNGVISFGDKKIKEERILFVDSIFPALFPIVVKSGSSKDVLSKPGFVLLTERTAGKFFGDENPVGKRLKLDNRVDLQVAAVIADAPGNTHLPYSMLVSYLSLNTDLAGGLPIDQWGMNMNGFVYMGMKTNRSTDPVEKSLADIAAKNINAQNDGSVTTLTLQPLSDIHFNQAFAGENPSYTINYQYLYLSGAIGLFLILAACINYTNLSTALALRKSKEVGVRKTMGAKRAQLIGQFLSETFLTTAVVILLAALTVRLVLPAVNTFLDKNINLNYLNLRTGFFLFLLWIVVSLLSGIYPALILSGFNPISALKSKLSNPKGSAILVRRGLVTIQFLTAQVLIIGAIVVTKQMNYINSKPLGFQKDQIVDIVLPGNKPEELEALRNKLLSIPGVAHFSYSLGAPISDNGFGSEFNRKEKYATEKIGLEVKVADRAYQQTYSLKLLAGRWFNEVDERKADRSIPDSLRQYSVVINETALKALGFANATEALGKEVAFALNEISAPIIGVMKDYHVASLHAPVSPVLMVPFPFFYHNLGLKLNSTSSATTLAAVEKAFSAVYPNNLFESSFLDEHIAKQYKEEKRTVQLLNLFTILSVLINALGLVGLLSFVIQQKTKEIGIRKVLGATAANISFALSKDFLQLVGIAFIIAVPVAWHVMNRWLQDFAYRTTISWWVFGLAGIAAVLVACVAIGFQTVKASSANPVAALRNE
jgi:putative ABC transport system permease protein